MRTEFINRFTELNASALENAASATKEIFTNAPVENAKPVFTAANLWNIHNQRRVRVTARAFLS